MERVECPWKSEMSFRSKAKINENERRVLKKIYWDSAKDAKERGELFIQAMRNFHCRKCLPDFKNEIVGIVYLCSWLKEEWKKEWHKGYGIRNIAYASFIVECKKIIDSI